VQDAGNRPFATHKSFSKALRQCPTGFVVDASDYAKRQFVWFFIEVGNPGFKTALGLI
jgi:hypothetical protein